MKLYFVEDDTACGDNADLWVLARSQDEAVRHWLAHYGLPAGVTPEAVTEAPVGRAINAFIAGEAGGAIPWSIVRRIKL